MWDPRRRNRNIGTAKAGHGAHNRMTIPQRGSDPSVYWQNLTHYVAGEKAIGSHRVTFLVDARTSAARDHPRGSPTHRR